MDTSILRFLKIMLKNLNTIVSSWIRLQETSSVIEESNCRIIAFCVSGYRESFCAHHNWHIYDWNRIFYRGPMCFFFVVQQNPEENTTSIQSEHAGLHSAKICLQIWSPDVRPFNVKS